MAAGSTEANIVAATGGEAGSVNRVLVTDRELDRRRTRFSKIAGIID